MFLCDKCGASDAYRINIEWFLEDDPHNKEKCDLCFDCLLKAFILLLNRLPKEERSNWLKAYLRNIIQ